MDHFSNFDFNSHLRHYNEDCSGGEIPSWECGFHGTERSFGDWLLPAVNLTTVQIVGGASTGARARAGAFLMKRKSVSPSIQTNYPYTVIRPVSLRKVTDTKIRGSLLCENGQSGGLLSNDFRPVPADRNHFYIRWQYFRISVDVMVTKLSAT